MDQVSEFEAVAITESQFVPWPRIAAVAAMVSFSLPTFITGLEVYHASHPVDAILALGLGSLIIFAIGALMGTIGAKTHLSSYLLVRIAFGDRGAGLVNIAFAISLLGWFGININLFAEAAQRLTSDVLGWQTPALAWTIIASLCMTAATLYGFKAINTLATLLVPILAGVTLLMALTAFGADEFQGFLEPNAEMTLSLGDGISAVVGAIIVGAIILPDITRFTRHWSGALYIAFLAYVVVQIIVMMAAAIAGHTTGQTDILDVMISLGLGWGAFIIVIAGSWVLNSLNLYSAVLSTKATFPKLSTTLWTLVLGAVGIIAGVLNLLDYFITFLFYLSVIFVPVAGVVLVDFFLIRPQAYSIETLEANTRVNLGGFVSWGVGAAAAILMSEGYIASLTGMAAMDAALLSGVLYLVLSWHRRSANNASLKGGA